MIALLSSNSDNITANTRMSLSLLNNLAILDVDELLANIKNKSLYNLTILPECRLNLARLLVIS